MAEPRDSYPEHATHGGAEAGDDATALRAALAEHDEELAAAVEQVDELDDVLTTAILVVASADEDDVEYVTESVANLVRAGDGLSTAEAAVLATAVGENADELAATLETVVALQREGHLDDLETLATAFAGSLSPEEVEELAATLEAHGTDVVEATDVVVELHRSGELAELVELARTLSALDVDDDAVAGLNAVLGAVGEANRTAEPVGLLGLLSGLRGRDARAGLGYLLALLRAQGRRLRGD